MQTYQAFMRKNGWPMSGMDAKGKSFYFGSAQVDVPERMRITASIWHSPTRRHI